MRIFCTVLLALFTIMLTCCASGYKLIEPKSINFISSSEVDSIKLEYKYDLLDKKYEKKEIKKGVKLVAIKVTNNSENDIVFGRDVKLTYANGSEIYVMENEKVFKILKQSPATYLFYLLLTPVNFYTHETNAYGVTETTSSTPIGLVLGPALAGGNMIAAGSANKKFQSELFDYNIHGATIKKGETKHGLIGILTDAFESLKLKVD
ncbi:hypothetical protein [uncultured Algibacter sp.]|uniref:hypothetical protein n=1 Tax=uncultured Algibacter sp. TaxID=298659 RepID=UPI00261544F9|nr:hypothetical protein [uncultured Algibacter sp.]